MNKNTRRVFGLERLEARRPLAGDVAGILADNTSLVVENIGANSAVSHFVATDDGVFFALNDEVWKSNRDQQQATLVAKAPGRIASGATLNDQFLFTVNLGEGLSSEDAVELWVSDGTEPGTEKLADVGIWDVFSQYFVDVDYDAVGDLGLITVTQFDIDESISTLWTTDGTAEGTGAYTEEFVALWESAIHDVAQLNDDWYFVSRRGRESDFGLWKTDPIAKTTELVRSFNDPPFGSLINGVGSVATTIGDEIYFSANDGETDYELWKSDGAAEGTDLVKDINPNRPRIGQPGGAAISMLTDVAGKAFFIANDGVQGLNLWTSDGTAAGTRRVTNTDARIQGMVAVDDSLYFAVQGESSQLTELWSTNGTEAGTSLISQLPGRVQNVMPDFSPLLAIGERVFFTLDDGIRGVELWVSDGTPEGTTIAVDINPASGTSSSPRNFVADNNQIQFLADDGSGGIDLWSLELEGGVGSTGTLLPGDVDGNGEVDFSDFLELSAHFGETDILGGASDGDLDEDRDVDFADFLILSKNFGKKLTDV